MPVDSCETEIRSPSKMFAFSESLEFSQPDASFQGGNDVFAEIPD
jgi:hypothetical protein